MSSASTVTQHNEPKERPLLEKQDAVTHWLTSDGPRCFLGALSFPHPTGSNHSSTLMTCDNGAGPIELDGDIQNRSNVWATELWRICLSKLLDHSQTGLSRTTIGDNMEELDEFNFAIDHLPLDENGDRTSSMTFDLAGIGGRLEFS